MKRLPSRKSGTTGTVFLYILGAAGILLALMAGLCFGGVSLSPSEVIGALFGDSPSSPEARILWYVRMPRTMAALLCGAALSASGAVLQEVLGNRLASPSVIGVNSGAGLAVVICSALGLLGGWQVSLFAFLGALLAVLLVALGSKRWGMSQGTVILMGVALNALFGAVGDTVTTFMPEVAIYGNDFKIGDFSSVTYKILIPASAVITFGLFLLLLFSKRLEVLALGDDTARSLGMNTVLMRVLFLGLAALLAGAAVSLAGLLSFVGLLVPHAVRGLSRGGKHLLPLSAILGAGFVAICDTLARTVFAPYEVPVGIFMAFLGAPFFLFILIKGKGGRKNA